ncbi:MAG TPA: hypothetical protein VF235_03535 [Actinomycetota bacterium]
MERLRGFLNDPRGWLLFTMGEFALLAAVFLLAVPRDLPNWANLLALGAGVLVLFLFNGWLRRRLGAQPPDNRRRR